MAPVETPYRIAVGYDMEPLLQRNDRRSVTKIIQRDLDAARRLGIGDVCYRHVESGDAAQLIRTSKRQGLRALIPDRRIDRYIATGHLPVGVNSPLELADRIGDESATWDESAMSLVVSAGRSSAAATRSREFRRLLRIKGVPCAVLGDPAATREPAELAQIDLTVEEGGDPGGDQERWLAQFHRSLAAGATGGVVLSRFHRPPGDGPGIALFLDSNRPWLTPGLKVLIARARCWGDRLQGARTVPTSPLIRGEHLKSVMLVRGKRRFLLIYNESLRVYARGEVLMVEDGGGQRLARAVEVRPSPGEAAGRVVQADGQGVRIPVTLRPGDAALFEIF